MIEFISREYGQKEFEIIIKTDCKEHYDAALNFARGLIDHAKPKTYADRIRVMRDIELAKLFTQAVSDGCPPVMDWSCQKDEKGWDGCDECWCRWLKQPAEE